MNYFVMIIKLLILKIYQIVLISYFILIIQLNIYYILYQYVGVILLLK